MHECKGCGYLVTRLNSSLAYWHDTCYEIASLCWRLSMGRN